MSLLTDIIFVKALQADRELIAQLPAGDVYNTTIALPDEEAENAQTPYAIVMFDGLTNDQSTKDSYEGESDSVNISIEVAAKTRQQLGELTQRVRRAVVEYFESITSEDEYADLVPEDYQFTASQVNYDPKKPCYWQILSYQCDTAI